MGLFKRLFGKKKQNEPQTTPPDSPPNASDEMKPRKYHVSMNKDETSEHYKMWRVRMEKSNKTIKYFKTQNEAIQFAEKRAEQAGTSVVIHKTDGSIRKQDYSKKVD